MVKKKKKIMEDHHDDCGDDLSSLDDGKAEELEAYPHDHRDNDALSDDDHNYCIIQTLWMQGLAAYPIDRERVAKPHPGEPAGPDKRAPSLASNSR